MYKVKRTIYVDNQSIDVWFGLVSKTKNGKNGKYTVYLLTDDPNNPYNHAEPILSNITSKETAVRKAIEYTKELFHNILISQKNNNKSQEDNGKSSMHFPIQRVGGHIFCRFLFFHFDDMDRILHLPQLLHPLLSHTISKTL